MKEGRHKGYISRKFCEVTSKRETNFVNIKENQHDYGPRYRKDVSSVLLPQNNQLLPLLTQKSSLNILHFTPNYDGCFATSQHAIRE